ncbi:MAG: BatA domain-containing protein [Candidatus Tectimicrobiota bacterium]
MGVTFLQPAFLLGALAAAVPVLMHLIYRRRALVHRFPAVRFLLLADKRTARKFRIHQWLLLALRVLVILLLVLLLARPHLTGSPVHAAAMAPPQATVVLIDNSLSMLYHDGQETRLQRAKTLASRLLQELGSQDSAVVVPLLDTREAEQAPLSLSGEQSVLQEHLEAVQPSHARVDMLGAFQRAFALLQETSAPRRRVVLLSDLTLSGWEDFHISRLPAVPEQVTLHCIRLGGAQRDPNVFITDVRLTERPFIEHAPLDVTVVVQNRSGVPLKSVRVDLLLGSTPMGQQLVNLGADEHVKVPFRIAAPPAGLHWGEVRLEGDSFTEDDRFYYALRTVAPVQVLLVDGDPGTSLFDSEIFYLLHALQPRGVLGRPLFYPKPIPWEGLEQERLSAYQVIVLCNVEAVSPQVRQRLQQFVSEGGGLLFFAGNRVDPGRYNAMFYRSDTLLLPLALGQPIQMPQEQPMGLATLQPASEAFAAFAGSEGLLQRGRFYRYLGLETGEAAPGVHTLLTLQDGRPLLVAKDVGRGRVLLFASSADRDWTDLPTRTAYVPLIHTMLDTAAHLAAAAQRPGTVLPEPAHFVGREEDMGATIVLQTPDAQERLVRYTRTGALPTASYDAYTVPGIYRLALPTGPDFLAVNATRGESNFEKVQALDLQARLRPLTFILEEEATLGQTAAAASLPLRELAQALLLLLVAVVAVENICANRL